MGRPKAQLKTIREDWPSPKNTHWKDAEKLARKFRRLKRAGRGCPSADDFVFQLCELVSFALISDVEYAQFSYHIEHSPTNLNGTDDGGLFLQSFYDCEVCKKVDLYTGLSRNRLVGELKKILNRNKELIPKTQMAPGKNSKSTDVISDRTLKRHVTAWLTIVQHSEWLNEGIPKDHQHLFLKGHIAYVKRLVKRLTTREHAEYVGLLEFRIRENFPNAPLLTP